jgi:FAD/FMN-containing dehydrogenase
MDQKKERLTGIVGKENVLDDTQTLKTYASDHSFTPAMNPSLVVRPGNVDEVQAIVKFANETATPLVTVSSGQPRFRGDTVPSVARAVIVDLSRMNRIISINRRNRVAIVEPGVTYSQLQPELAREGLRLSTTLLPRRNKSVIASLLEREPRLIPRYQWVTPEPLRCIEVIWGDGNKLWTGEAGGGVPVLEEQWKREQRQVLPAGPNQVNFYQIVSGAQGTMGIVTWASLKCEILPPLHKLFFVPSEKLDNLLDFTYRLLRFRFGDELLLMNSTDLANVFDIKTKEKLPPWVVTLGIAGRSILPEEKVESQEKDITEIARQFGLSLIPAIPGISNPQALDILLAPSREPHWKLHYKGGCQDIFFLTTLEKTPEFVKTMFSVAQSQGYPASDIGVYIQPQHQGASCHCEFNLPFNPDNQKEVTGMQALLKNASEELLKQGAYFSRPYGIWADMAFSRDPQMTNLVKKVKGIFDPNHVMNPGKLCF